MVNIGTGYKGFLPLSELTNEITKKTNDVVSVGDEIELVVKKVDDLEECVILSKKEVEIMNGFDNNSEAEKGNLQKLKAELETEKDAIEKLREELETEKQTAKKIREGLETERKATQKLKEDIEQKLNDFTQKENEFKLKVAAKDSEIQNKEKEYTFREKELANREKIVVDKEKHVYEMEMKTDKREADVSEKEIKLKEMNAEYSKRLLELESRERTVNELEKNANSRMVEVINRENGLLTRETALNSRESSENEVLSARRLEAEKEVLEEKNRIFDAINTEIAQKRKEAYDVMEKEHQEYVKSLSDREKELDKTAKELEAEKERLAFEKQLMASEKNKLIQDQKNIELTVNKKVDYEKSQMDAEKASWSRQREELFTKINEYDGKIRKFERIVNVYGDDPQVIIDKLDANQKKINELVEEILNFDKSKAENFDVVAAENTRLESELQELKKDYSSLKEQLNGIEMLQYEKESLILQNKILIGKNDTLQTELNGSLDKIKRLSTSIDPADESQRIKEIKKGILPPFTSEMYDKCINGQPKSEISWLRNIENKCKEFGIVFPRRILYAFHTALKISDWSTITVLAGVSGTGKSELPRLYSKYGGIQFINVPVQPNWDSKESMLGYFNSIDNQFEAQEILRFLAQCTDMESYGGCMAIVLLDEMNLAHVELYFAEFLSKLEERRGKKWEDVPEIEVKLGAGMPSYGIKMARNILWTGTMNQDETTNSLSDKVLDRGIVINFPRPTSLISRNEMKAMESIDTEPCLQYDTWDRWLTRKIDFTGEQAELIEKYRKVVNDINMQLEKVGRALGHRVWQSVEYYIANYPTVIEELRKIRDNAKSDEDAGSTNKAFEKAVRIAFEDQVVQKIMPKLRGIETSGESGEALEEIIQILRDAKINNLDEDFENAMRLGYGQFMWNSAKYIEKTGALQDENDTTEEKNIVPDNIPEPENRQSHESEISDTEETDSNI